MLFEWRGGYSNGHQKSVSGPVIAGASLGARAIVDAGMQSAARVVLKFSACLDLLRNRGSFVGNERRDFVTAAAGCAIVPLAYPSSVVGRVGAFTSLP